jgi:hypothetical protein
LLVNSGETARGVGRAARNRLFSLTHIWSCGPKKGFAVIFYSRLLYQSCPKVFQLYSFAASRETAGRDDKTRAKKHGSLC